MKTKKKAVKKPASTDDKNFVQEQRVKIDVRVSEELDSRVEALSTKIGTTKNSIFAVATMTYVSVMERVTDGSGRLTPLEIKAAVDAGLREMLGPLG